MSIFSANFFKSMAVNYLGYEAKIGKILQVKKLIPN